ncbi:MAG: TonB-dependent receptor plug domain-containing protein, partial [Phormidesmis sp. FL-bin-119]|nr:TonB-dependent receptor plug domain-containing protein [Pedobacter sp.]
MAMLIGLLLSLPCQVLSQNSKLIKGTVSEDGQPLPGVNIRVKGTAVGTTTIVDGKYSIQAKSTDILVFAFLGMKTQEVVVGPRTSINISLQQESSSLNEVVVIGYGSVAKPDLTGSVGVVSVGDLNKAPVGSFAEALAGRVAGVQVSASDGQPGAGINIVIRGAGSLTQSTSPLYVIDGFPVEDLDPATLNTEDIESMTILKDASSTAIYG